MPEPTRSSREALLGLLGLAARAGALIAGTDMVRQAVREGKVEGVLIAADASPAQQGKLLPLLEARGVRRQLLLTRAELGRAIGRNPVTAVAVTDRNFAGRALEMADVLSSLQE